MGQVLPNKSFREIGGVGAISRRAISFTPADDMTVRQFSFMGMRRPFWDKVRDRALLNEVHEIEWEIRDGTGAPEHKPEPAATRLLASGTFDWRYSSAWKLNRPIKHTTNLGVAVELTGGEEYFFILQMPEDETNAYYPLTWIDTYVTGDASEVDATIYSCEYYVGLGAWADGDNSYNLTLYILDAQAGNNWHVILNGCGYMQPDKMRGYRCEQASTGLAASRGGQSAYSQLRYPYSNLAQDNWTSGGGQITREDPSAFLYSVSLDTLVPNQAIIGPAIHLTGTDTDNPEYAPATCEARTFPDGEFNDDDAGVVANYVAQAFIPTADVTATSISARVNRQPWAFRHTVTISLCANNAGVPGAVLGGVATDTITPAKRWKWCTIAFAGQNLVAGTTYWITVQSDQVWGFLPEHRLMYDTDGSAGEGNAFYSVDDGVNWAAITNHSLFYQVNYGQAGSLDGDVVDMAYGVVNDVTGFYALAGKEVYEWDEAAQDWTALTAVLTVNGTDIIVFNNHLFVAQGYDNPVRVYDGTIWTALTNNTLPGGEFEDAADLAEWTEEASSTLTSDAGTGVGGTNAGKLNADAAVHACVWQEFVVEDGAWYQLIFHHKNGGGVNTKGLVRAGNAVWNDVFYTSNSIDDVAWTRRQTTFQVTGTTLVVSLITDGEALNDNTFYDEVELHLVPVAKYFHIGKGYLWQSTGVNSVSHSNTGEVWSSDVTIGTSLWEITAFANYQGRLLVGKESGLWEIDDQDLALAYLSFEAHADPDNCKGMAVWSGMLFVPVQNTIWRWQGSQYKVVGPNDVRNGLTSEWPNDITCLAATPSFLLASASPIIVGGWGGLVAYNGLGWHHIATATRTDQTSNCVVTTSELGTDELRFWFAEGDKISYVKYPTFTRNRYDWESADFEMTSGSLQTGWWDGGVKDAVKFWNRLTLIADMPPKTSITVWCARDGADWTSVADFIYLGELSAQQLEDNGEYVLMFPDGMVAKSIQPIFLLNTNDSTKTPRLKAFNVESIVRQPPVYNYSFRILLANNITKMDTTTETARSANTMWEELKRTAARNAPVVISFPSESFRGMISHLAQETLQFAPDGMGNEKWERVATVSIIEAT